MWLRLRLLGRYVQSPRKTTADDLFPPLSGSVIMAENDILTAVIWAGFGLLFEDGFEGGLEAAWGDEVCWEAVGLGGR